MTQALDIGGRVGQSGLAEPDGCATEKLAAVGHQSSAVLLVPVGKGAVEEWGLDVRSLGFPCPSPSLSLGAKSGAPSPGGVAPLTMMIME